MSRLIMTDRKPNYLLPPSLEDWLNQDHLARHHTGRGSAAHHPATLLAILVYGYATGIFLQPHA